MTEIGAILANAQASQHPSFSGASVLLAVGGEVVTHDSVGVTARYADDVGAPFTGAVGPVNSDTVFDLASITKVFTAIATLTALHERGLGVHTTVAEVLPEFRGDDTLSAITVAQLLSHTAGFPPDWRYPDASTGRAPDPADAWRSFRRVRPIERPGAHYTYSCVGYLWAGLFTEALTGDGLDVAVRRTLTGPLGLDDVVFAPRRQPGFDPARIAATEFQRAPARGLVHGEVHDEAAWALGGVTGNAGLFGSARSLLAVAELLRTGGWSGSRRILAPEVVGALTTDALTADVGRRPAFGQALGPRIADADWMGMLADARAIGHTGFTGTSMLTVPGGEVSLIILTNRVHPSRAWPGLGDLRRRIADVAARA
ncbi:serine hydrolase domain-containing protein [Microbacterium sp. P04]|uniref:serine hydrolase domain-containing protein n=1 Tax=Microbacterium sp. P04 TaxID=3366947 RepID=UPI00374675B8